MPARVAGDAAIPLACFWQADRQLERGIGVSVRLMDTTGVEWARGDFPLSGLLETNRWPLNEPIIGRYELSLPGGLPPGDFYRVQLILDGVWGSEDAMVGPLVVGHSTTTFTATLQLPVYNAALENGGLVLEAAAVRPEHVRPGEQIELEAVWRVARVPFVEPMVQVTGQGAVALLPDGGGTDLWQVGDRYHTITRIPISPTIQGGPSEVLAIGDGVVSLGSVRIDVVRVFNLPPDVPALDYRLGDAIRLVGAEVSPVARGTVGVTLYWQAQTVTTQSYTTFVHLFDPSGALCDQRDALPRGGAHPTDHWRQGEVVSDTYVLKLCADEQPGTYRIVTGMYTWPTLERLTVQDAGGVPVPNGVIPAATFEVKP